MQGMNDNCIDLIYLDPPFNSNAFYGVVFGDETDKNTFKDTWTLQDVDLAWWMKVKSTDENLYYYLDVVRGMHSSSMMSYLIYMAVRLLEMKRVLKPTGSIYLHCDPHASHYLKQLMDIIFGRKNFIDEIVWNRVTSQQKGSQYESRSFGRNCDYILHYAKTAKYTHNEAVIPLTHDEIVKKFPLVESGGRRYNTTGQLFRYPGMGPRPNLCYTYKGVANPHPSGWRISLENLKKMDKRGEIIWREGKKPLRKMYADEYKGKPIGCLWTDIPNVTGEKRRKYPTQKPIQLLQRIIRASSNEGDLVLDPFCGCATTLVASQHEHRQWVGIDISPEAANELKERLAEDFFTSDFKHETKLPIKSGVEKLKQYNHPDNIITLYGRQAGYCFICYKHRPMDVLSVDHIIARSKNGTDHLDNLQLVCHKCNSAKGDKSYEEALAEQWKKEGAMWEKRKHEAEHEILKMLGG